MQNFISQNHSALKKKKKRWTTKGRQIEDKFLDEVKVYLSKNKININWDIINNVDLTVLVTTLASICPFSNAEKQIILECSNTYQIPNIMLNLFKMSDEEFNKKSLN